MGGSFCNRVEHTGFINPAVLLDALSVVGANSLVRAVWIERDGDWIGGNDRPKGSRFLGRFHYFGQRFQRGHSHGDPLSSEEKKAPWCASPGGRWTLAAASVGAVVALILRPVLRSWLGAPGKQFGDVSGVIQATMMGAIERQTHHLQGSGHPHLLDFSGLGKLALEVHQWREKPRGSVRG